MDVVGTGKRLSPQDSTAIVLLSGGMDSAVTAVLAKQMHKKVIALNMYYGQKHQVEIECARHIADKLALDQYHELDISAAFKNLQSSLLQHGTEIDNNQPKNTVGATYVPGRNMIFLSIAAGFADSVGAEYIYYGAHMEDFSGYPDCRPEFIQSIRSAILFGTKNGVNLVAPLMTMHKQDVVTQGMKLGVPFMLTHSCYRGKRPACGTCPTCKLRLEAFKQAGYEDPILYEVR